jgi:putative hemolysin
MGPLRTASAASARCRNRGGPAIAMTSENSWAIIMICKKPGPETNSMPKLHHPVAAQLPRQRTPWALRQSGHR